MERSRLRGPMQSARVLDLLAILIGGVDAIIDGGGPEGNNETSYVWGVGVVGTPPY